MEPSDESGRDVVDLRSSEIGWVLGRAIRRIREARGLSQEALSRRLEMSRETVRRMEFGEGSAFTTIDRVIEALDSSVAELLAACDAEDATSRVYLQGHPQPFLFRDHWPSHRFARARAQSPRRVMTRWVG